MKKSALFGSILVMTAVLFGFQTVALCADSESKKTDESEWKSLFDGKTTEGWRGFRSESFPEKGWEIVDGTIHKIAKGGGGDIVTEEQFHDFELCFEWKVAPGANSGVFYRVSEDHKRPYDTAPEYQVLDDDKHRDGKKPITSAASNYALYPRSAGKPKPVGEFNEGRIVVKGNHIEHWLNGEKAVECEIGSEDWNKRIAKSKFRDSEFFATVRKGHIALQDHGDDVWYRNIKIKTLSE